MEYVKLNKSRHAVKQFNGEKIPTVDVKQLVSAATLAPSAHNIQPWKFIIVASETRRQALQPVMKGDNWQQIQGAGAVVALFSDTDLRARSHEIAATSGGEMPQALLERYQNRYPHMFMDYAPQYASDYLALNAGLVAMNFVFAAVNAGFGANIILGFHKELANAALDVDARYRPELFFVIGKSDSKGEASFRLPQEKLMELR